MVAWSVQVRKCNGIANQRRYSALPHLAHSKLEHKKQQADDGQLARSIRAYCERRRYVIVSMRCRPSKPVQSFVRLLPSAQTPMRQRTLSRPLGKGAIIRKPTNGSRHGGLENGQQRYSRTVVHGKACRFRKFSLIPSQSRVIEPLNWTD